MRKKLLLIVNPFSGRALSKSALGGIVTGMCDNGYAVTVLTPGGDGIEQLTREYAADFDLVVCAGGDGTLSAVVNGLVMSGAHTPLGYIPTGTTNDFATTLELSRNPLTAMQTILTGVPRPLDVGSFGEQFFTYIAAFGAFTGVSYTTPQNAKRTLGHLAYVLEGLASVSAIKEQHVVIEYDGGVIEDDLIFGGVTNSTSVAGLVRLGPEQVDLSDGQFEVILVKRPITLVDFGDILTHIMRQDYSGDNVQLFHSSRVKFTFDTEVMWTRDGEDGGLHRELEIVNRHEAIRIIL